MLISELVEKLQLIEETNGDREVVVIRESATGCKLVEPDLCKHYTDANDETKYVLSIV
jgi:hypothetical protein